MFTLEDKINTKIVDLKFLCIFIGRSGNRDTFHPEEREVAEQRIGRVYVHAVVNTAPVPRRRMTEKESSLTSNEKKRYKALIGQLSWVATPMRLDIAFETSVLSSMYNRASLPDLLQLNKLVERTKKKTRLITQSYK